MQEKHEAGLLRLDCSKAMTRLGWKCTWNIQATFAKTIEWYKAFYQDKRIISSLQLSEYTDDLTQPSH
jgi:CDP-glucose 4,6-dehydratase